MRFHRAEKKCYLCGGTFDLRRCSCGRYYCPAHGFGGKCLECQKASLETVTAPRGVVESYKEPITAPPQGAGRSRLIHASVSYDALDTDTIEHRLARKLNLWRRVVFEPLKVEGNGGITCYFKSSRILWRIELGEQLLELTTDLGQVSEGNASRWEKSRPMEEESGFPYVVRFVHNETLFICEVVLRASGAQNIQIENELPMTTASPRALGACPWCGTIARGLSRCPNCGKVIPKEMNLRELLKIHYRRQIMGEMIALRTSRMGEKEKRDRISEAKAELAVLEEM